jgi:hypothetical protein
MPWADMNPLQFWMFAFPIGALVVAAVTALIERGQK